MQRWHRENAQHLADTTGAAERRTETIRSLRRRSFETAYAAIAWLCWVPNLLLAILFTRHSAEVTNAG